MKNSALKISAALFILLIASCVIFIIGNYIISTLDCLRLDLPKEYAKKPTDWLLGEMDSFNWRRAHVAYITLVDRKEKRAIPKIIRKLKKDKANQAGYIQALTEIRDPVAIPVIVETMKSQKEKNSKNDIYWQCIISLAKFKYEPIWPEIIRLAQSDNAGDMRLAIDSMVGFDKEEALPYLKKIKTRLESGNYKPFIKLKDSENRKIRVISIDDVTEAIAQLEK